MVAYNFQARFTLLIADGRKRGTIRAHRKSRHAQPGDAMQLYTGMRTKNCMKIGDAVCRSSEPIIVDYFGLTFSSGRDVVCAESDDSAQYLELFATQDGFDNWNEMVEWFDRTYNLPFQGVWLTWGNSFKAAFVASK